MHSTGKGVNKKERIKQSEEHGLSVQQYRNYIPIDDATEKLNNWKNQGAQIYYLTSRTTLEQIDDIKFVLKKYNFPDNQNLFYCQKKESYKDVAEKLSPDILIEDNCESIGGEIEMTYPHIKNEIKSKIKSIVVKEFGGIDHLPDKLSDL